MFRELLPPAAIVFMVLFSLSTAQSEEDIASIVSVLRDREALLRSGSVIWDEAHTIQPGAVINFDGTSMPKSIVRSSENGLEFRFDKDRYIMRYYLQDFAETGKVKELSAISFDGAVAADYNPPILQPYGNGVIHQRQLFGEFGNAHLWPFLCAFRPVSVHGAGLGLPHVRLGESRDEFPDAVVLESEEPMTRRVFLLDVAHKYRLKKMEYHVAIRTSDAKKWQLSTQLIIDEYDSGSPLVDIPKRWTLEWFAGNGTLSSDSICQLVRCEVNPELQREAFSIMPFPEGTLVHDERDGNAYWQKEGQLVPATGLSVLVNERSDPTGSTAKWLLVGNALVFLVICCAWWVVRRRHRSA